MEPLNNVLQWLDRQNEVRAVLLTGSRAIQPADDLSDYDLAIFGNDFSFISNDDWLGKIAGYLVCVHDSFLQDEYLIPTRLVIFNTTFKIDFSFHPPQLLQAWQQKLPDAYNIGYRVLLDKDGLTASMPEPAYEGFNISKPDKQAFQRNVHEFWFEVHHVVKYLSRADLWIAKSRDWATKQFLLEMLLWEHAIAKNWKFAPKSDGSGMQKWINSEDWNELDKCFGKFNVTDSFESLENTVRLYRKAAHKVAASLGHPYNEDLDREMTSFMQVRKSQAK